MYGAVETLILMHVMTIALVLALFAILLVRQQLFHWASAGFWTWAAFALYFVAAPLATLLRNPDLFVNRLAVSGGLERGLYIMLLVGVGMSAFFVAYLKTPPRTIVWGLKSPVVHLNPPIAALLAVFIGFGLYSLLTFRAGLVDPGREAVIVGGRFVGEVTGYQNAGYMFLFVPIFLLLLSPARQLRLAGWSLAAFFIVFSLPHAWSRFATVSMLLALSIFSVLRAGRRWPPLGLVLALLLVAAIFQLRGHVDWRLAELGQEVRQLVRQLPERGGRVLAEGDTAMLSSWYVSSYLHDRWIGYDYGIPLANYALTGWIPTRWFPDKYFMIDWLNVRRGTLYPAYLDRMLYGAKTSLFGSFYAHAGWLGVVLGSILAGVLSRRLDGMLAGDAPLLVKAVGASWLSVLWIAWGSSDTWVLTIIGILALPALALWLVARWQPEVDPFQARARRMRRIPG